MATWIPKVFLNIFHVLCVITTIGFVGWCINEYSLDHDYSETTFATFHETLDDMYPSITVCVGKPVIGEKINLDLVKKLNLSIFAKTFESVGKSYEKQLNKNFLLKDVANAEWENTYHDWYNMMDNSQLFSSYMQFLRGTLHFSMGQDSYSSQLREFNVSRDELLHEFQKIDYDLITVSLKELLTDFHITFQLDGKTANLLKYDLQNGSLVADKDGIKAFFELRNTTQWEEKSIHALERVKTYVSLREVERKCFTFDIPMAKGVDMREIGIELNVSSSHGKYHEYSGKIWPGRFLVYLTYPNQFLREPYGSGIEPKIKKPVDCYKLEIHVGYMRVIRRRDKKSTPCNSEWRNHDKKHMEYITRKVGCCPMHWKLQSELPHCTNEQQLAEINRELFKKNGFMPPCRSIETLLKTTDEMTPEIYRRMCLFGMKKFYKLKVWLDEQRHYEEVFLFRSYSLQTLVGNSGK